MKNIYLIVLLFGVFTAFGQTKSIPKKIQDLNGKNQVFKTYQLFSKNNDASKAAKYAKAATDVTILNVNSTQLNQLNQDKPQYLELKVPYQNEEISVQLFREQNLTDDFVAKNAQGQIIPYIKGQYYRGIIKGDYTSLVAISIFENDVKGVISHSQWGNINLGKSQDRQDFVAYSDKNSLGVSGFSCGIDELEYNQKFMQGKGFDPHSGKNTEMTERCVRVYYELTYITYQMNNSNETETLNWITAIQNNIGTLYTNDDVKMALSEVNIWTTQDPYTGNYSQNLYDFRDNTQDFNGDIAHLVNYPATTSVAFLDSLCSDYSHAYSGIDMFFQNVPTYSWTIMAMTHEMGHGLGSPHTHACFWNGNNTAIDGCGPAGGYSEGCDAPIPDNGGTIMSYCHLVSYIDFTQGFGPQPAAQIRNTVESKLCLSTDCESTCEETMDGFDLVIQPNGAITIQITDDISEQWSYAVRPLGSNDPYDWQISTSKNFQITGISEGYNELTIGNSCEGGLFGSVYTKIIYIGDLCGETFTDTGGPSGNYNHNEDLIATFYPQVNGEKVTLTFTSFQTEFNYDFMYVHNGNSLQAPLFANGNGLSGNTIPGPFTSTATDGSITVHFVSDGGVIAPGWIANVNCGLMAVSDLSNFDSFSVYPNPTSDVLNIQSEKGKIQNLKLTDVSGKLILNQSIDTNQTTLKIGHLPKGVYLLTLKIGNKEVTKKIIKN